MGSTKLQHDHYRALGIQVRNTTMCTSRNNPGPGHQNNCDEQFQWQSGLYPDLSGLFGGGRGCRKSSKICCDGSDPVFDGDRTTPPCSDGNRPVCSQDQCPAVGTNPEIDVEVVEQF